MSRFYQQCDWWSTPHLNEEDINDLLESCEPNLREARSTGTPAMGAGQVYPVRIDDIAAEMDFRMKGWYRRAYGMDVGWNVTAAVWGAYDGDNDVLYVYDAYMKGQADPEIHASAIRRRNPKNPNLTIPGAIDPGSKASSQVDGRNLLQMYRKEGLLLVEADNSLEAGIHTVYGRMASQKLKIVRNPNTEQILEEIQTYRRDDKGKIVNKSDYHLLDSLRYLVMTGIQIAKPLPPAQDLMNPIVGSRDYGI